MAVARDRRIDRLLGCILCDMAAQKVKAEVGGCPFRNMKIAAGVIWCQKTDMLHILPPFAVGIIVVPVSLYHRKEGASSHCLRPCVKNVKRKTGSCAAENGSISKVKDLLRTSVI